MDLRQHKKKTSRTGSSMFPSGYINAYPKATDGYNRFFDVSLAGAILNLIHI